MDMQSRQERPSTIGAEVEQYLRLRMLVARGDVAFDGQRPSEVELAKCREFHVDRDRLASWRGTRFTAEAVGS